MARPGVILPTLGLRPRVSNRSKYRIADVACPYAAVVIGILIACPLIGLCVLQLWQSRMDALVRLRKTSRNLGLMAKRDIERNVELYDRSLQAVLSSLRRPGVMNATASLLRNVLLDHAITAQFLDSMLGPDAGGTIILDFANEVLRQRYFSDQKYLSVHRDDRNVALYVSEPLVSGLRASVVSIVLSRRISNLDGSFGSIVLLAINIEYFHQLFAGLSFWQHGPMPLIGNDGILVMRHMADSHIIGRNIGAASTFRYAKKAPESSFSATVSIDVGRRLYNFKHMT